MKRTTSTLTGPPVRRRATVAAVATVGAAALIFSAAPAVQAAPAEPAAASEVAVADDEELLADFAALRQLVVHHRDDGGVTDSGARRLFATLDFAELYIDFGYYPRAAHVLENLFKLVAEDSFYVPSETARDELVAAADALIEKLGGLP